ncbi:MAG: L-ribulokinase [Clostridiales bacterium]|nr:L-ribulokinase [Clostridiales bacterium]
MAKYTIGIDYGTESARALLLNLDTAEEVATAAMNYPHGVMDERLPNGMALPPDWALQHPDDYIEVLKHIIPEVIKGIDKEEVIGIGIDFTSCTILPTKKDGTPLCDIDAYKNNPHAYVKLWKHHAAQDEANRLNEIARQRDESFLERYGGKISSEWVIPKIWQILNEAPEIYEAADRIMEATDWVIMMLTGNEKRNSCTAGYKAIWSKKEGYPSNEFFAALDPRLEHIVDEKLSRELYPVGTKAGGLTQAMAQMTGLKPGIAVAVGNVDAHVSVPAMGVTSPGKMVMIMGTSICHMVLSEQEIHVPGICGVVEDGIIPGLFGYEAGQSAVSIKTQTRTKRPNSHRLVERQQEHTSRCRSYRSDTGHDAADQTRRNIQSADRSHGIRNQDHNRRLQPTRRISRRTIRMRRPARKEQNAHANILRRKRTTYKDSQIQPDASLRGGNVWSSSSRQRTGGLREHIRSSA